MKKFNLYFKFNKCSFHVFHVNFLDFRISLDEITMQTNKIIVVKDWSEFKSHRNVQIFIDFANFYKRFVHAFFKISVELFFYWRKTTKTSSKLSSSWFLRQENSWNQSKEFSWTHRCRFIMNSMTSRWWKLMRSILSSLISFRSS